MDKKRDELNGGDNISIGDVGAGAAVAAGRGASASVEITKMEKELEKIQAPVKIFLSSTWLDLQPEREAVEKALHRMKDTTFIGMEYFGSRPDTAKNISLKEVDESDIYVGIFAHRYGSGITEDEYQSARSKQISCLVYLKADDVPVLPAQMETDPDGIVKLARLKDELRENHIISEFKSPENLATQVIVDLHNILTEKK